MTDYSNIRILPTLTDSLHCLHTIYDRCYDIVFHEFRIGEELDACIVYLHGLADSQLVDQQLLVPLSVSNIWISTAEAIQEELKLSDIQYFSTYAEIISAVSMGAAILVIDGEDRALGISCQKWETRNIEEPSSETVVRGPREGFVESISVNTSMLRRKLRNPDLKLEATSIGKYSQTEIVIAYIEGIIRPSLVSEMMTRLKSIQIDGILESSYIEELIEDNPLSPFPQLLSTERPDIVCASLLEGRIAVLVAGTPFVLIAPGTLAVFLQSPEDYYQRFYVASAIRMLRYIFIGIALLAPSIYIAVVSYHQEMIPTKLLLSMAKSREDIPFPALVEALLMEVTFEALREAGIRLPKQVGAAVSIVGALVIGQAAIASGLVSAPMVMVVAITGIASFMVPHYGAGTAIRLMRFPIMITAGILGLLGVILSILAIIIHLLGLRSFGVPYLTPISPVQPYALLDLIIRAPRWLFNRRPRIASPLNRHRQSPAMKPGVQGQSAHKDDE
ncbi:spore germination protein [Paenibacillus qinlingensis]|uniref:spore germination protein n=1 Tax=Paenibacillus qinlingensis TaxID=1837343 RepID=UPI001564ACA5|nr:spore germination protein [Paenibacillus qinlingensis]NQX64038.1 spore germination protein [Paenibacillus qinlingensis]